MTSNASYRKSFSMASDTRLAEVFSIPNPDHCKLITVLREIQQHTNQFLRRCSGDTKISQEIYSPPKNKKTKDKSNFKLGVNLT